MKTLDIFRLSVKNIRRGRLRVLLTMLSISIGIASVILITSIGDGGKNAVGGELESMGINGLIIFPNSGVSRVAELAPEDAQTVMKRVDGVEEAMPLVIKYGTYRLKSQTGGTIIWGVGRNLSSFIDCELLYGRFPNESDIKNNEYVALVDSGTALAAYKRENIVNKTVTLTIDGDASQFRVIGIYKKKDGALGSLLEGRLPMFIYVPYSAICELTGVDKIDQLAVKCSADTKSQSVADRIVSLLSRVHDEPVGYDAENMTGYREELDNIAGILTLAFTVTAGISLLVAGIGIMNIMLASVSERKKEVGICMAIGASRVQIAMGFLFEAGILSAAGGILGAAAGAMLSLCVSLYLSIPPFMRADVFLISEGITIAIGLIFGVVPALRASRMSPIEALREE